MKKYMQLLLFSCLLAYTVAYPGLLRRDSSDESGENSKEEKDGILLVLPNQKNIFDDLPDRGIERPKFYPGFWDSPMRENNPFDNIFAKMQEAMRRWAALTFESALKDQLNSNATGFGTAFGSSPFGKIPEGANVTSTTKVIGNHTVVVNETTHRENNEFGSSIFHVKIVEVKPLNHTFGADNDDDDIIKEDNKKPETSLENNSETKETEIREKPTETKITENKDDTKNDEANEISKNQVELIRA